MFRYATQYSEEGIKNYTLYRTLPLSEKIWSDDTDQNYTIHFVIEFDRDFTKFGGWVNDELSNEIEIMRTTGILRAAPLHVTI